MKTNKKILSIVVSIIIMISFTLSINAKGMSLNNLSNKEFNTYFNVLTNSIVNNSNTKILSYMTIDEKCAISKVRFNTGELVDINIDKVNTSNSTTDDTVVFVKTKIKYGNSNKLYLFEYHINKDGNIYGHNIWGW